MAQFKYFINTLLKLEGGFVNNPADKGKATNKGITLGVFQQFYGHDKTVDDLKRITDDQAKSIYYKSYWVPIWCDRIGNQSIANIFCDWAVNSGIMSAARQIQKILKNEYKFLGVEIDGIVGNVTLNAIAKCDQEKLFNSIKAARKQFYLNIVAKNPSQKVFLKGWLNRLDAYKFEK